MQKGLAVARLCDADGRFVRPPSQVGRDLLAPRYAPVGVLEVANILLVVARIAIHPSGRQRLTNSGPPPADSSDRRLLQEMVEFQSSTDAALRLVQPLPEAYWPEGENSRNGFGD